MASPKIKLTLQNANIISYSTDASIMLTYWADFGTGTNSDPNNVQNLVQAMLELSPIGTPFSGNIPGGPTGDNNSLLFYHVPRVYSISPRIANDLNPNKLFIDVMYKSRPRPNYQMGSGANQVSTNTYLSTQNPLTGPIVFSQMALDYTQPAGVYGATGSIPWFKTPFTASKFQFGATFRLSSTFYADELTPGPASNNISALQSIYTATINSQSTGLLNQPGGAIDDTRKWLTTSLDYVSNDGGFTNQLSIEMIFNPYGWDAVGNYTIPFSNLPALIQDPSILAGLTAMLSGGGRVGVPPPYAPAGGGVGRFPQQIAVNTNALLGFLCQGTGDFVTVGTTPQQQLAAALNPAGWPTS